MSKKLFLQQDKKIRNSADLSCQTLTTSDMFVNLPVFSRVVIPDDKFTIKHAQLNNVNSLPVPAFVDINCRNRWFYSKFEDIWLPFEAWVTDSFFQAPNGNNEKPALPQFSNTVFYRYLAIHWAKTVTAVAYDTESLTKGDFVVVTDQSGTRTTNIVELTSIGRRMLTIMRLLGYNMPHILDLSNTLQSNARTQQVYNMLPLLAYYNVMLWNYVPEKWRKDYLRPWGYFRTCFTFTNFRLTPLVAQNWNQVIAALPTDVDTHLHLLLQAVTFSWLGDDYFTSSLVTPMDTSSMLTLPKFEDLSLRGTAGAESFVGNRGRDNVNLVTDTPQLAGSNPGLGSSQTYPSNITAYMQNILKSVTLRVQQRALSPNSVIGRMFSMFGVKSEQKSWLPTYLDGKTYKIVVRPEIANSDTESSGGKPLGYRGGTAQGYDTDNGSKHYEFTHYGCLFCINTIAPRICYIDGIDRENMWSDPTEFARPEMQNAGFQAISNFELTNKVLPSDISGSGVQRTGVFGYTPPSAELMHPHDRVGGAFMQVDHNSFMDKYFLHKRVVSYDPGDPNASPVVPPSYNFVYPIVNNENFAQARPVDANTGDEYDMGYDRIFNYDLADEDHIEQWNYFEVYATRNVQDPGNYTIGDKQGRVDEITGLMNTVANG